MNPEPELHFQPDPQVRYDVVDQTLAVIKRSNITKLGFITSLMSAIGSPGTATRSAHLPASIVPVSFDRPMAPAGTLDWPEAWIYLITIATLGIGCGLYLAKVDPALLAERMKPPVQNEQPAADKAFVAVFGAAVAPGIEPFRVLLLAGK